MRVYLWLTNFLVETAPNSSLTGSIARLPWTAEKLLFLAAPGPVRHTQCVLDIVLFCRETVSSEKSLAC